jgi:hypothetical protein
MKKRAAKRSLQLNISAWERKRGREQEARQVYAVSFVFPSSVRSMVPPHPQPGPQQQQQLKATLHLG